MHIECCIRNPCITDGFVHGLHPCKDQSWTMYILRMDCASDMNGLGTIYLRMHVCVYASYVCGNRVQTIVVLESWMRPNLHYAICMQVGVPTACAICLESFVFLARVVARKKAAAGRQAGWAGTLTRRTPRNNQTHSDVILNSAGAFGFESNVTYIMQSRMWNL